MEKITTSKTQRKIYGINLHGEIYKERYTWRNIYKEIYREG